MEDYVFNGLLFVPGLSRPLDFLGEFTREPNGYIDGKMELDPNRSGDFRNMIRGSLFKLDYKGQTDPRDLLVFHHTKDATPTNITYFFDRTSHGSFDGEYAGKKNVGDSFVRFDDLRGIGDWCIDESKITGTLVDVILNLRLS